MLGVVMIELAGFSGPEMQVAVVASILMILILFGGLLFDYGKRQGVAETVVTSGIRSVNEQLKAHGILEAPEMPHARMVSNAIAAEHLAKYIRAKGDSRWLYKGLIEDVYFWPMCQQLNITARSWEGVYRALCQNAFTDKQRIFIGSNETYSYLWDYTDERTYPYLLRVACSEEVERFQRDKVSAYLAHAGHGNAHRQSSRPIQKRRKPVQKRPKTLKPQRNTWTPQDTAGVWQEAA